MRWANIQLQCLDCGQAVEIVPDPDEIDVPWFHFKGKCKCGEVDLTDYIRKQTEDF